MAFKDLEKVLYDGKIKLDYKDKAHRYYARPRVDFELPEDDPKAWGKIMYPKGTTTLIGDTLEKKGLMTWPMGLALRELFGFYDFTNDSGDRMTGFSKDVGTMWELDGAPSINPEMMLPIVQSASKAWQRKQKKGADIGTVVHNAIEQYVLANPNHLEPVLDKDGEPVTDKNDEPTFKLPDLQASAFDIGEQYMWSIKDTWPLPEKPGDPDQFEAERNRALEEFPDDVKQAEAAFAQFKQWWNATRPTLFGAEDLLYSIEHNVCGTYDADLGIKKELHPLGDRWEKPLIRVTADWKTSNASKSEAAAMPEGINYQYFTQSAIYELLRREMGMEPADDLLIVSARKDGGFTLIYASELGFTMNELLRVAESTILLYRFADKCKKGLIAHAEGEK